MSTKGYNNYSIVEAEWNLEDANRKFEHILCLHIGVFCLEDEREVLKKFLKELNSFRGVLIIDAKVSLKKFGEEYAFKSGYGESTTKAKSLKTLSSLFYDVLLAEIELKLVKGEISDDEFEEFLGEKLTNNINYESSIKVKKTSNENLDYCNNSYMDEKMNKSSNTYQANVFIEGNCPKCGHSVNKFTNNPVAIKCHMCNHTFWF